MYVCVSLGVVWLVLFVCSVLACFVVYCWCVVVQRCGACCCARLRFCVVLYCSVCSCLVMSCISCVVV